MKKVIKIILLSLLGLLVVGTFVFLWNKSRPKIVEYEIIRAEIKTIEKKTVATGKIEPRDIVMIKPQISGIISHVYKQAGQHVKSGEVIALVKVIPEMSLVNAAESRVNVAKIELDQQKSIYDRDKQLYESKVISAEEFEKSTSATLRIREEYQNAVDNLEIVRQGMVRRSGSYGNTRILSTITGTILDIPIKAGNSVIQSNTFNDGTTIAVVANLNDMIFQGKIDETEVGRIKVGMPLVLTVGALQNVSFDAELEYISPKGVEENSAVMFEIRAAAYIPDSITIRSGYSANAEIILQHRPDVLAVPESTVSFENDSTFVYSFLKNNGKKQLFQRQQVKIGLSDGMYVEITEGLDTTVEIRGKEKSF
ncbi:MAG: efflux RND transporter periplasmic adaptor subunit [Prevotellaceae bacterium]|jgi:HlyD family secretion protein|nr:efflux RND transporter periplasmic adaptor subunit [Prevotellaceae bacterium]